MSYEENNRIQGNTGFLGGSRSSNQELSWGQLCAHHKRLWAESLKDVVLVRYGPSAQDVLIGKCPPMRKLQDFIQKVAPTTAVVLIEGESGTGKESLAQAIRRLSRCNNCPLISVDCSAVGDELFEQQMFGYEDTASQCKVQERSKGAKLTNQATLFLARIDELLGSNQLKLLRILKNKRIWLPGNTQLTPVEVRIIATTTIPLWDLVSCGIFRVDLYWHLNQEVICLPPLRQRSDDILVLAKFFITFFSIRDNKHQIKKISARCQEALLKYPWPGNVQELKNAMQHAVIFGSGPTLLPKDIPFHPSPANMVRIENTITKAYALHPTTNRMSRSAEGSALEKSSINKKAIAAPEQDILEIGLRESKPYLLINQKPPKKHLEEWLFVPLVLLSAARKKGKNVNKIADLLLPEFTKKEQLLTEIRHFLMTATFKTTVDRRDILPSDRHGNVELQVFEKDSITVDHSICKFESQHMVSAEKAVDETLQLLKAVREQDSNCRDGVETDPIRSRLAKLEQKALKASLVRLKYEAKLTFKHTRMVMKAVEIMRWKLQNEKWRERWNNLVTKCRALFEYDGYSERRMEEDFYLPQRGRQ